VTQPRTPPARTRPEPRRRPRVDSVERFLSHAGDAWTFLVLREAFFGVRRFDAFQRNLAAAPNILTDRLKKLVANGVLAKVRYQTRPPRFEYRLTEKGLDLYPAIVLMMRWGDRWLDRGRGAPLLLTHGRCGKTSRPVLVCDVCSEPIAAREMRWRPGPGAGRTAQHTGRRPVFIGSR
jgi:DNA-binding HxlR family transcriptional regulator